MLTKSEMEMHHGMSLKDALSAVRALSQTRDGKIQNLPACIESVYGNTRIGILRFYHLQIILEALEAAKEEVFDGIDSEELKRIKSEFRGFVRGWEAKVVAG